MTAPGSRRHNATGRSTDQRKLHKIGKIDGSFIPLTWDMLESPAWKALTHVDRRILDRLGIEHLAHGGNENGNLKCTYSDFESYGVRRASIAGSIRRLEQLGFLEVVERGRITRAEFKFPAKYRLTYVMGNIPATHEWREISQSQADAIVARPKGGRKKSREQSGPKSKNPGAVSQPEPDAISQPLDQETGSKNEPPEPGALALLPSISREEAADDGVQESPSSYAPVTPEKEPSLRHSEPAKHAGTLPEPSGGSATSCLDSQGKVIAALEGAGLLESVGNERVGALAYLAAQEDMGSSEIVKAANAMLGRL